MRKIINFPAYQIEPDRRNVLETQGIPPHGKLSEEVDSLLTKAEETFLQSAKPVAVISGISIPEFRVVYGGEGLNEKQTPVAEIMEKADTLSLFAVTIGEVITDEINSLFKENDFALASMLDSVASAGTDRAADMVERHFIEQLSKQKPKASSDAAMRFSPGYCGWDMSGQRKLFEFLQPEEIGIELLESFLMKPLKSISGVLIFGPKEIFNFEPSYAFCSECRSRSCLERIDAILGKTKSTNRKGAI